MAIPTAKVKIEVLRIKGVPVATLSGGDTRYAKASMREPGGSQLYTGRSRPIPNAGGTFELTPEKVPWRFEVSVDSGTDLPITIELWEDQGDLDPPVPTLVSGTVADPWTSGLRTLGTGPSIDIRVTTTLVNPVDPAFLARAGKANKPSGTLTVPQGFVVQIVDILGLYKPNPTAVPPTPGSSHVVGYISQDNWGRIFTNRVPDGTWTRDTQYIEVQAKVIAFGGPTIPAGAKIQWTISDPDDPTNDDSNFHRGWGRYVDPGDYDGTGKPTGAEGNDNKAAFSGNPLGAYGDDHLGSTIPSNTDATRLFGAGVSDAARWAAATGGPAPSGTSETTAQTPITLVDPRTATSSVRVHCPNVLGTSLTVRAEVIGTPAGTPVHSAATGVMTMWSRIDVEVVRMAGAISLASALPSIPVFLLPACVQLDFKSERGVSGPLDLLYISAVPDGSHLSEDTLRWVNNAAVFTHQGQGGWFFLGAARLPNQTPGGTYLYRGNSYTLGTTGSDVWVEVPGPLGGIPDFVTFSWSDGTTSKEVGFIVRRSQSSAGNVRIFLWGNDVTPEFTGHDTDGSVSHAMHTKIDFFPRHQAAAGAALVPGGFGVPLTGATVTVVPPGIFATAGISPPVHIPPATGQPYFAGRTVIFTRHGGFASHFDENVISTVVHEFLHAFGMPHKCGYWDWRTPRWHSCCMNYPTTWLLDASHNLLFGTAGKQGNDMCGRHLMEVRRVHLEKNLGLGWH